MLSTKPVDKIVDAFPITGAKPLWHAGSR